MSAEDGRLRRGAKRGLLEKRLCRFPDRHTVTAKPRRVSARNLPADRFCSMERGCLNIRRRRRIDYPEVMGMELLEDGLIAFFSAVGMTSCVWLIAGAFLGAGRCRNPGVRLVLPVEGNAPAMESDLRDLLRLRRQVPGAAIVLEDRGLTGESRELAEYFCRRYDGVVLRREEPQKR